MNPNASGGATPADVKNLGLWESLMALLRRLFGGSENGLLVTPEQLGDLKGNEPAYVIAPGGYRIRVPQAADVSDSVGELIPEVREGLALLPPLPHVVVEILREIQDPRSTASSVAQIAASDPALAASLLRMVNSAASGLVRKTTSVSEAVSYLGFAIVRSLVIKLRLEQVLPVKGDGTEAAEDLWVHSLAVSYVADALAERVGNIDRGFVWTLGLLHDIGKLAILSRFPERAAQPRAAAAAATKAENETTLAREARVLGADHAAAGATLAWQWKLPADLVQAIRWHHNPEGAWKPGDPPALRRAMYVVQVANQLAKYCYTYSDDMEIDAVPAEVFKELGLPASMPQLLDHRVRAAITKAIFFAEETTERPLTSVRRFLHLHGGEAAARLVRRVEAAPAGPERVRCNAEAVEAMFAEDCPVFEPKASGRPPAMSVLGSARRARFAASATTSGLAFLAGAMVAHHEALELPAKHRQPAKLLIRTLLPNLLDHPIDGASVEAAQYFDGRRLHVALRSPALAFARRLGAGVSPENGRRVLEAELANALNIGWFESVEITPDGSAILLAGA